LGIRHALDLKQIVNRHGPLGVGGFGFFGKICEAEYGDSQ
jgi:hypothetical protein